ncbi:cupin domain-containing protein [candidate division KSB1 bacterium]|nr:cupin domain-containing protein [candidate division KSB1 bacterium]
MKIKVEKPSAEKLVKLDVANWPIWTKEVSEFPWYYDEKETCLILEGHVLVTPEGGEPVEIKSGDFVEFPVGLRCVWKITKDIRKHYNFG